MEKRAVILAGGKGTRLKPYTMVLPKPLVPIHEYPVLELIIRQLKRNDFSRITLAVNHMAELIMAYFGNGEKWGIHIDYSLENKQLSTMGPLKLIKDLPENFLVMNGDVLTDLDLGSFFDEHIKNKRLFSIASHRRTIMSEYGVLDINEEQNLIGFREKPGIDFLVSMGIYMVNRDVLDYIPEDKPYGFDNLMLRLIQEGKKVWVKEFNGYWLDIGRPDDYSVANDDFEKISKVFLDE